MTNTLRSSLALAVVLGLACASVAAQSAGEAVYAKSKCQSCHGSNGMADTAVGKALKVKPVTDPAVKAMSPQAMIAAVTNGSGKMQAYKGKLTDEEIKDSVMYFRTFLKK